MAVGGFVQVTNGVGPKVGTGPTYTEQSSIVQDPKMIMGLPYHSTYTVIRAAVSLATANAHIIELVAGASLNVHVTKITVQQDGDATTAGYARWQLWTLTSAGTGGTALTPQPNVSSNPAVGATARQVPTTPGTESSQRAEAMMPARISGSFYDPPLTLWQSDIHRGVQPLRIAAGITNGLAVKQVAAIGGASAIVFIEFIELPF